MGRVKFVSYDGEYPNLCSGVLVLNLDGNDITFPKHFLSSGGSVTFNEDYSEEFVEEGQWHKSCLYEWPEEFSEFGLKEDALEVINDNIEHGCCGGCI